MYPPRTSSAWAISSLATAHFSPPSPPPPFPFFYHPINTNSTASSPGAHQKRDSSRLEDPGVQ